MIDNQETLLQALKEVLHRKKSNDYYSKVLNVTVEEIEWAREELRKKGITTNSLVKERELTEINDEAETGNYIADLEEQVVKKFEEDVKNGTAQATFSLKEEIHNLDELIEKCDIDVEKWEITKYVQNYWGNADNPHWQVKAWLSNKELHKPKEEQFQEKFIEFLSTYTSDYVPVKREQKFYGKRDAVMVIPKQDFHFDKLDYDGDNDIIARQDKDSSITEYFVEKASAFYNLKKVYYVLGGDYFNSEYTKQTTKGTPQQNALASYHTTFNVACMHEMFVIKQLLRTVENIEVVYIAGNHDYYVCWHLVQWLAAYFRNEKRVTFDSSPELDKVVHYWDTSVMLRHGNEIKPQQLANIFPTKYRKQWAESNHTYIITGDKHSEKSQDFGATRHYQVPALSSAKSFWDQNNGFVVTRTEHSAFIIEEGKGISDLFREYTA
jgi:hypothetical protein